MDFFIYVLFVGYIINIGVTYLFEGGVIEFLYIESFLIFLTYLIIFSFVYALVIFRPNFV